MPIFLAMSLAESQKPLQRCSIAARKFWQFDGFCGNFYKFSRCFVTKLLQIFRMICWQNSIKIYANWSEYFQKDMQLCWKISIKIALLEYFHKILLCGKFSQ